MIDAKLLKRLMPALEAVKERDAADFREKRDRAEALRAEIAAIHSGVAAAAAGLDPSDLAGYSAFLRYRQASLARIDGVKTRLAQAESEEHDAREKLSRSHGSVEGCSLLAKRTQSSGSPKR